MTYIIQKKTSIVSIYDTFFGNKHILRPKKYYYAYMYVLFRIMIILSMIIISFEI